MNKIYLTTGDGRIEILAPLEKVRNVATSGDNTNAVNELKKYCDLSSYSIEEIKKHVEEYGIELNKNETRPELESLLLWCLAWDYMEGISTDEN